MPPVWKTHLARVRSAIDARLGDEVRITPIKTSPRSSLSGPQPDSARPAFTITALLRVGEGDSTNLRGTEEESWKARIPVGEAELRVDFDRYPQILKVQVGDLVEALDRDNARFEVAQSGRRDRNRLVLRLNAK